jgi:hypothetical protein
VTPSTKKRKKKGNTEVGKALSLSSPDFLCLFLLPSPPLSPIGEKWEETEERKDEQQKRRRRRKGENDSPVVIVSEFVFCNVKRGREQLVMREVLFFFCRGK